MITKIISFLLLAGACLAFPADEEVRPPNVPQPVGPPQPLPGPPQGSEYPLPAGPLPGGPLPSGPLPGGPLPPPPDGREPQPPQGPSQLQGQDNSDLKTDNTFWWRRSYYPIYYSRSYYRPRSYSTYSSYYTPYYSYWNPYYWW